MVGIANDGERGLAGGVETVDRLQQAQRGHLHEVVDRFTAALVATGELASERKEAVHELLAGAGVSGAVVEPQQSPLVVAGASSPRDWRS